MAVTNLTGYTWVGNEALLTLSSEWNINFTSNGNNYTYLVASFQMTPFPGYTDGLLYDDTEVWFFSWNDNAYRTITITGGSDVTNSILITMLEENGTLTPPTPTITNIYKGV